MEQKERFCVIIPTYNNEKTLKRVVLGALEQLADVLVVNDGSTDSTSSILDEFATRIERIDFGNNQGKGMALRKGIQWAIENEFDYVITIDSDGQHAPTDIPRFVEFALANPQAVVMGARNMEQTGVPKKSSFGNKFSNFWFQLETGIRLPDTQTGFRLYPLSKLKHMRLHTRRFELEIEIIVRLAWKNTPFYSIPIAVRYDPEERVSHFRPGKDFFRISVLNSVLVLVALVYRPIQLFRRMFTKAFWSDLRLKILNPNESKLKKASAVGVGLCMGIFPAWGFQMLIALGISIVFRLNKFIVLATSNISIPPMIPFIVYGSYLFGGLFMNTPTHLALSDGISLDDIYINLKQYLIGSVLLSFVAGALAFCTTYLLLSLRKNK